MSGKSEFSALISYHWMHFHPPLFFTLHACDILLNDIFPLSTFPLSLKLFSSLNCRHMLTHPWLTQNRESLCVFVADVFFPGCTRTVINIGDPNTVIGYIPGGERKREEEARQGQ